jgi:hypothetical protein
MLRCQSANPSSQSFFLLRLLLKFGIHVLLKEKNIFQRNIHTMRIATEVAQLT